MTNYISFDIATDIIDLLMQGCFCGLVMGLIVAFCGFLIGSFFAWITTT